MPTIEKPQPPTPEDIAALSPEQQLVAHVTGSAQTILNRSVEAWSLEGGDFFRRLEGDAGVWPKGREFSKLVHSRPTLLERSYRLQGGGWVRHYQFTHVDPSYATPDDHVALKVTDSWQEGGDEIKRVLNTGDADEIERFNEEHPVGSGTVTDMEFDFKKQQRPPRIPKVKRALGKAAIYLK